MNSVSILFSPRVSTILNLVFNHFLQCFLDFLLHVYSHKQCIVLFYMLFLNTAAAKSLQSWFDSVRPHRRQPTRLPRPWDSQGKDTGVGCHFLLQCMKVKSEGEVAQSCPTLCNPIDVSPPGSPVPGILQARTLEWVAISFSSA